MLSVMRGEGVGTHTRLFVIRHGESTWNAEHRFQGQADSPLSALGQWQAGRAAEALAAAPLVAVYSSPLRRALETARMIAAPHRTQVISLLELMEVHGGVWQGMTAAEIEEAYPEVLEGWRANSPTAVPPGGETLEEAAARGLRAVERIVAAHPQDHVAVVTHGGIGQLILKGLLGSAPLGRGRFFLSNGSISLIEYHGEVAWLLRVNDTRHLDRAPEAGSG